MARVACTLGARIGPGSRSTVLLGGDGHVLVWVNRVRVDICKIRFYICRVVRKPQLGKSSGLNRHYSTRKESWPCTNIVVKK
jgi:hypothetical protein